jgi:hypothetical protein
LAEQVNVEAIEAAFLLGSLEPGKYVIDSCVELVVSDKGFLEWLAWGRRHRENGPAVVWRNGGEEWWCWGKHHRENGPAVLCANGTQEWWLNGCRHRTDGPAFICANGLPVWFVNGERKRLRRKRFNALEPAAR